jgi:hypothetical protein
MQQTKIQTKPAPAKATYRLVATHYAKFDRLEDAKAAAHELGRDYKGTTWTIVQE